MSITVVFFRGNYLKKCDNYVTRSLNHETYLQKATKFSLAVSMKNDVI